MSSVSTFAISGANTGSIVTLDNITCTLANTEYPYALPSNCKGFTIQPRPGMGSLKLAYTLGQSGIEYISIPANSSRSVGDISAPSLTLYFQSPTAGTIAEIESWS